MSDYSPEPDTDAGVPVIDGLTVVGRSAARDTDLEAVDAIEPDLLQVSSYNSSTSNLPYVLRVREIDPPRTPTCTAYAGTGGVAGVLPDLTALPPDLTTIILVNQERLGDTFGAAAADDVMAALTTFAARLDVNGVVIPVEGDPDVASAYAAWNANPCLADRANKVVNEITGLVVGIRNGALPGVAAHPALANVVIVGGDDIVPMARLDDTTRVGNETGYADTFDVNGPYYGALSTSHFLSDDPYGDLDPIQWATRRLYVPELALGRLVESPTQIIAQVDAFGAASGRLDASRALRRRLRLHDRRRERGPRGAVDLVDISQRRRGDRDRARQRLDVVRRRAPRRPRRGRRRRRSRRSSGTSTTPDSRPPTGDAVMATALAADAARRCPTRLLDGMPLRPRRLRRRRWAAVPPPTTSPPR